MMCTRARWAFAACLLTLLAVSALIGVACDGGDEGDATPPPSSTIASAAVTPTGSIVASVSPTTEPTLAPATATPLAEAIVLSRGDPSRREVALTFDAGSDAGFTAQILATLKAEGIRATFSVTGAWAESNVDQLLSIAADGHVLINHTYGHRSFTGRSTNTPPLTAEARALELSRVETTVYRLTSRSTRPYFRPPFGDIDESVRRDVAAAGFGVIVMWTIDTLGWNGASSEEIVERTMTLAEPGAIVIMHVGSESQDAAALPEVIRGLRADGYGFVTIPEMLASAR
jgi:peptidoglycan/xylan/chitin deacetylase (PgdA/CDA1 family)